MTDDVYHGYRSWKGWEHLFRPSAAEVRLFVREFDGVPLAGKRLLDIGFGSGALLAWARGQGAQVEGVEIQQELRAAALERGIPAHSDLRHLEAQRFDLITLFDVLEHYPLTEIPPLLLELARLLRPDARILVRVPNAQSAAGLLNQFGDATHLSQLSGPIIAQLALHAGLKPVSIREAVDLQTSVAGMQRLFRPLQNALRQVCRLAFRLAWSSGSTPLSGNVMVVLASDP